MMASRTSHVSNASETIDVVIVGAGISGINCAYRIKSQIPNARFTILEGRDSIGGTWDFFKYPGLRSDSDLFTFGFAWHPWPYDHPIAEGPLIMQYLKDAVSESGIDQHIRFDHKVASADWSSKRQQWTTIVNHDGVRKEFNSQFLVLGTGYYDYKTPLQAKIPGLENFKGDIIHPQFWPEDYDYTNKKMALIGSGATAVTLFPHLVKKALKATIVQRSPSYIVSTTNSPRRFSVLRKYFPLFIANLWERAWYLISGYLTILFCRAYPSVARERIRKWTVVQLPKWVGQDPHFQPAYNPWEQRMCLAPDGDFYKALHSPRGTIITGNIKSVTEHGIQMKDGTSIDADAIVQATGLKMLLGGGINVSVDGERTGWAGKLLWNGSMVQGVPNLMLMLGYAHASWTLGADDSAWILTRLISDMKRKGVKTATPKVSEGAVSRTVSMWGLSSTYVSAARQQLPINGDRGCWKQRDNIVTDYLHSRWGDITSGLQFRA